MYLAKFECDNKDFIDYVFLDHNGDVAGFSLDKEGIKPLHKSIIDHFVKMICINENCIEMLEDSEGYTVFYDQVSKFKHYFKDGKEDFFMFLKNNGEVALMYELNDQENSNNYNSKTCFKIMAGFLALNVAVYCCASGISSLLNKWDFNTVKDYGYYKYVAEDVDVFNRDSSFDYREYLENSKNFEERLTVDKAIQFINDSPNLFPEDKKILSNFDLLNDILPYYEGTVMAQDIKLRLNGIGIEECEATPDSSGNLVAGYYNPLEPSVIHVDSNFLKPVDNADTVEKYMYEETRKGIVSHEFIHMLQCSNSYCYLKETVAELMAEEYFDTTLDTNYEDGVNSLKLLIDIIGPEPILKGIFGGNFSDLKTILADNLSYDDYDMLMEIFMYSPNDILDKEVEIKEVLCRLYENIYGQDIRDDKNILYDFMYGDYKGDLTSQYNGKRYYLNKSKMNDEEVFSINSAKFMSIMPNNDFIEEGTTYYCAKNVIDYDSWQKYYKSSGNEGGITYSGITYYCESKNVERAPDGKNYYVYPNGKDNWEFRTDKEQMDVPSVMGLDEAMKYEYVSAGIEFITEDNELADGQEWCYDEDGNVRTLRTYRSKTDDKIYYQYNDIFISVSGIKDRFNIDSDISVNNLLTETTDNNNVSLESIKNKK